MSRIWALALIPVVSGCYFVFEPPPPPEPEEVPVPEPVPVPVPGPQPVPAAFADAGLSILWLVRTDPHTGNLASAYGALHERLHAVLRSRAVPIQGEAVGSLYDVRLLWGRTKDVPAPVTVEQALRHAASETPPPPWPCTVSTLRYWAVGVSKLEVRYPDELIAQAQESPMGEGGIQKPGGLGEASPIEVTRTVRPFAGARPAAFLIVLIDSGPRPQPVEAHECRFDGDTASEYFGGSSPATWLRFEGDQMLVREQIRFALIGTPEEVSHQAMTTLCEAVPGFPLPALDVIQPSPIRFFDRFDEDLRPMTERVDLCWALGQQWNTERFVDAYLEQLATLERTGP